MHRCWCYSSPSCRDAAEIAVLLLGLVAPFLQIPALLSMASFAPRGLEALIQPSDGQLQPLRNLSMLKDITVDRGLFCFPTLALLFIQPNRAKKSKGGVGVALCSSVFGVKVTSSSASALVQTNLIVLCMLQISFYGIWGFLWAFSLFLVLWLWQLAPLPFLGSFFLLIYFIVVWAPDLFPPPGGRPPGPASLSVCRVFAHGFLRKFFNLSNSLHFGLLIYY